MSRLTTRKVELWLQAHWDEHFDYKFRFTQGRMADMNDRSASLVRAGTPRVVHDGAFEDIDIRIQTRGQSNKAENAELIAYDIDEFLDGTTNQLIGDSWVSSIWTKNGPRMLVMTDTQSRYNFTADYTFRAERL